jgi:hypothetical protein
VLADDRVADLFKGLNFTRVDDRAGSLAGLIQEIWRPFLAIMLISLLAEAGLCMPRKASTTVLGHGTEPDALARKRRDMANALNATP